MAPRALPLLLAAAAAAAAPGPCDILGAAGNPCVAAHSTTRALYSAYAGPLYNVTRASDGASANISVLSPGGFANASAHEAFCAALDCVISNVFDQSPLGNHLHQRHKLVNASQLRVTVGGGVPVFGMFLTPASATTWTRRRALRRGTTRSRSTPSCRARTTTEVGCGALPCAAALECALTPRSLTHHSVLLRLRKL
jgi:hypothetical protein